MQNFLLFRRQIHEGPLYTQRHTPHDPTRPRRVYDQNQRNSQYVYRSKANADLFTAGVETFSSRFKARERTLPDLSTRPYVKRLFPPELHATLEGAERKKGAAGDSSKKLKLSSVSALPTAEEIFRLNGVQGEEALKRLEMGQLGEEGAEGAEEEEVEEEDEDYAYDDEDAGDYDAEAYCDDGDEEGDDGDDGGDDGGYY